jgi:hypothetical protein
MSGFMDLFNNLANTQFGQGEGIQAVVNNVGSLAKLKRLNPGDNAQDFQNMAQSSPYQQPAPQQIQQPEPQQTGYGNGLMQFILANIAKQQGKR